MVDLRRDGVGIGVFTGVEIVGLIVWLMLATTGAGAVGAAILFGLLVIEHIIASNVTGFRPLANLQNVPVLQIAVFSALETGVWVAWLLLTNVNQLLAAAVLGAGLIVEHTISDNVAKGQGLFSQLVDERTVGFSLIETVAAVVWLQQVGEGNAAGGIVVLAILSTLEHIMGIRLARQPT